MKEIKVNHLDDVPDNYTGIAKTKDGDILWFKNNEFHRENGPAVEHCNGSKLWYQHGELHRENGPAIEGSGNYKSWYQNGKLHREIDPAVEWENGDKTWYQNGKLHRLDGPAIDYVDRKEYWIDGVFYTKKEFNHTASLIQQQLPKRYTDYKHLTDKQWYEYLNILVLK